MWADLLCGCELWMLSPQYQEKKKVTWISNIVAPSLLAKFAQKLFSRLEFSQVFPTDVIFRHKVLAYAFHFSISLQT